MYKRSIGIDGFNLAMRNGTGVATYGFTLTETLRKGGYRTEGVFGLDVGADPAAREVQFFDRFGRAEPKSKSRTQIRREQRDLWRRSFLPFGAREIVDVPFSGRVETSSFSDRLPAFDRLLSHPRLFDIGFSYFRRHGKFLPIRAENPPEIMHWTYPVPISLQGARNIYTLHDLVPLRLPFTTLDAKGFYRDIAKGCAAQGNHISTVSEASKADIRAEFGLGDDAVTNTYQHAPLPTRTFESSAAEDAAMIEGIFGLPPKGYFLFFGAIEPKKNVGRLIEAHLSLNGETPLVIVGARAWQSEDELRLLPGGENTSTIHGRNLDRRIGRLDYLPRELLVRLIRSARAVVFPSLYEGFGLPVVEAMQLGTPVLTSSTSCLPEVAGDAAILVDPYDVRSIAGGLRRLDEDEELRARLSDAGSRQAELFSEARYLERLGSMYDRVMADQKPGRAR